MVLHVLLALNQPFWLVKKYMSTLEHWRPRGNQWKVNFKLSHNEIKSKHAEFKTLAVIINSRLCCNSARSHQTTSFCLQMTRKTYSAAQIHVYPNYSYAYYTRMSIRARTCVYTRVYVSLLCIPISFFIWSIVGWTRHIIFMEWKRLQSEICILLKCACWWMKAIIFRISITLQSHQQTNVSWTLAWS